MTDLIGRRKKERKKEERKWMAEIKGSELIHQRCENKRKHNHSNVKKTPTRTNTERCTEVRTGWHTCRSCRNAHYTGM